MFSTPNVAARRNPYRNGAPAGACPFRRPTFRGEPLMRILIAMLVVTGVTLAVATPAAAQ